MTLLGGNAAAEVTGLEELLGKSNYFIGNDPTKWRSNVPNFAKVKYKNIYAGVDLVYYGKQGELEYDFVVAPGADPKAIVLALETGKSKLETQNSKLEIEPDGALVAHLEAGEVRFHKPVVYQPVASRFTGAQGDAGLKPAARTVNRQRTPDAAGNSEFGMRNSEFVDAHFVLLADNCVGFDIGDYDRSRPLIIDPVLSYSTYLGGDGSDYAYGVAADSSGNAYVVGYANSSSFPVEGAAQANLGGGTCGSGLDTYPCYDAFVTKLNPAGTALVYSTYLGGSGEDYGLKIAVSPSGNAYVTGFTNSTDFPTANALQATNRGGYDAFVTELDASGSALVYSTYLGGSADDYGYGIALDSSANAHVSGFTSSTDFPTTAGVIQTSYGGGAYDAFVTKVSADGSALSYSTYLGGSEEDYGYSVAVDSSGSAYVAGSTNSTDFPTANALQAQNSGGTCGGGGLCFDAFVTKLNAQGSALVYSTYLGGGGDDYGCAIAVDTYGNAYVTGYTASTSFPTTAEAFQTTSGGAYDVFVTKLNAVGSAFIYSTYLGGMGAEIGYDIAAGSSGIACVTGYTYGSGFPGANPIQADNAGFYDVFVTMLNASGSALIFSTPLGGSGNDVGRGIALDSSGSAYVTGSTFSTDFPTTPGAFGASFGGGAFDAFLAKLADLPLPGAAVSPNILLFPDQVVGTASATQMVTLTNSGTVTLNISRIEVSGDFAETHTCGASLAPGANCTISVTFTPTVVGTRTGTLTITDDAVGSPHAVALSGTGVVGYSLSASSTASVTRGTDSADFTVFASSPYEFSGSISLTCASVAPASCVFNPSSITPGESSKLRVNGLSALAADSLNFVVNGTSGVQTASISLVVLIADFSLAASPTRATIAGGESATFKITVSPSNVFSQGVELSCAGAPSATSCSIVPSSLTLSGDAAATATLTLKTTARSGGMPRLRPPLYLARAGRHVGSLWLLWLLFLALLAGLNLRGWRHAWSGAVSFSVLAFSLLLCLACGGGGGRAGPPPSASSGTPAGTYTITVTGKSVGTAGGTSGVVSHSTTLTLTVN